MFDRLESRSCPVCGAGSGDAVLFLRQSIDPSRLTEFSYASRKSPEFMSFELLACTRCKTVYASSGPPPDALARAYHEAQYDSAEEAKLAAESYERALSPFFSRLPSRARALEIGTGTGAFLSILRQAGFAQTIGIEPSHAAVEAADREIKPFIREGIFVEEDFEPESFDLICCFQTLEHVPNPRQLVESSARLLRRGGMLALVTHDYRAPLNRILGRRSPIIDVEHLQLFCRASLEQLLSSAGLDVSAIQSISNRYPLKYWLRLAPLPPSLKSPITRALNVLGMEKLRLSVNVGNLVSLARRAS